MHWIESLKRDKGRIRRLRAGRRPGGSTGPLLAIVLVVIGSAELARLRHANATRSVITPSQAELVHSLVRGYHLTPAAADHTTVISHSGFPRRSQAITRLVLAGMGTSNPSPSAEPENLR